MRKLRVLTLLHELSLTGAPKVALDACNALREDIDPLFVSLYDGPLSELCLQIGMLEVLSSTHREMHGVKTAPLGSIPGRLYQKLRIVRSKKYFSSLRAKLTAWQPDVIYANTVASLNMLALLDMPEVPVLLHVHELDVVFELNLNNDIFTLTTRPSRYVAVAEPVREMLVEKYGIDAERISLIHEFVPDDYLQAIASTANTTKTGPLVVGGAGFPGWRKGTTPWLQMAVELKRLMGEDQVRFVWVGTRDDESGIYFKTEARKLKIYDQIEFVPVTKTPLEHYAKFDVFAMTSYEDPCPLVVLENMILKKPVFCFAGSGGAPEEVGETGIVIEDYSPIKMAAAIAELAADPERRKRLGEQARERVKRQFVASLQAPKILADLKEIAATK